MKPKSQCERVLDYLEDGYNTLTQLEALEKWGIMRLGAVVYRINEKYGCSYIKSELIKVRNRYGQKVMVARYSI